MIRSYSYSYSYSYSISEIEYEHEHEYEYEAWGQRPASTCRAITTRWICDVPS
jgi:hypothetical protein